LYQILKLKLIQRRPKRGHALAHKSAYAPRYWVAT
jgi:hypothetical protein